jgi:hypothetical protein
LVVVVVVVRRCTAGEGVAVAHDSISAASFLR